MTSNAKVSDDSISNSYTGSSKSERLYYLDWLQVLAILGVFLFHAVHPFDDLAGWHIKNAEKSVLATFFYWIFQPLGDAIFLLDGRGDQLVLTAATQSRPLYPRTCHPAAHSIHHRRDRADANPGLF